VLAPDPCEICIENDDAGAIPIDELFPSGDLRTPFHPNCRCAVVGARPEENLDVALTEYDDSEPRDKEGRWTVAGGFSLSKGEMKDVKAGRAQIHPGVKIDEIFMREKEQHPGHVYELSKVMKNPKHGVPLVEVIPYGGRKYKYQLVDGHHRLSAYKELGNKSIPAIETTRHGNYVLSPIQKHPRK
jgi:hypothetical protein